MAGAARWSAAAQGRVQQCGRGVELLVGGQVGAGGDDRVYRVQDVGGERRVGGGQLCVQVVQGAGADEGAGDGGVGGYEAQGQLDHGQAGLVGELGQLLDGVQSGAVGGDGGVEALGHEGRAAGGDVA